MSWRFIADPTKKHRVIEIRSDDRNVLKEIKTAITEILNGTLAIYNGRALWSDSFRSEVGTALLNRLGEKHGVFMESKLGTHRLLLFGWEQHVSKLVHSLKDFQAPATMVQESTQQVCEICLVAATKPILTVCSHYFCQDCFAFQCSVAERVPITCVGGDSVCDHVFSLEELDALLPSVKDFETVLRRAFDIYVRSHVDELGQCPTADCRQVYQYAEAGSGLLVCYSCLDSICISCRVPNHVGTTCEQYQKSKEGEQKAVSRWKKKHNIKDCPRCGSACEKDDGCNRVICASCTAQFCWICLTVCEDAAALYDHLDMLDHHYEDDVFDNDESLSNDGGSANAIAGNVREAVADPANLRRNSLRFGTADPVHVRAIVRTSGTVEFS